MALTQEQNKRKQELLNKFLKYDFLTYDEIKELAQLLKKDDSIDKQLLPMLLMGLKQIAYHLGYEINKEDNELFKITANEEKKK